MKSLVIYYSHSGHTQALAQALAKKESAAIVEIKDAKRAGKLKTFTLGCFSALLGKDWPIQTLDADLKSYKRLLLCSPIWAGNVPPAVNAVLKELPAGKTVSVKLLSASGKSGCKAKLEAAIKTKGCTPAGVEDIKAEPAKK